MALSCFSAPARAQLTSDFEDGTAQGWQWGAAGGPLVAEADAGPRGPGDFALRVLPDGAGAGGRLVFYNMSTWGGNWPALGRTAVHFRILHTSGPTLIMRVNIDGPGGRWCSGGVSVAPSAGWQDVTIPTAAGNFTPDGGSSVAATLGAVSVARIVHNPAPLWRGVEISGTFYFDDISDRPLPGYCGDGTRDAGEDCDGTQLGGATCMSRGFDDGVLGCTSSCTYDTSACFTCGDGNQAGAEVCDGADHAGQSCASLGFDDGILACNGTCSAFVTTACYRCGDGVRGGPEVCDGADIAGQSCTSQGLGTGALACNGSCTAFDGSGCSSCGDAMIGAFEVCDGALLGGQMCVTQGFDGGALACDACTSFDTSACFRCGDGVLNGAEVCDGTDTGAATCASMGLGAGVLGCNASCTAFDTFDCTSCGDAICGGSETIVSCPEDCHLIDPFDDTTTMGWMADSGAAVPVSGVGLGPESATDDALVAAPGGGANLVVLVNAVQWTGNFTMVGRTEIYAHARNDGTAPLQIRVAVNGPGGRFATTRSYTLPGDGRYYRARWEILPTSFTASGGTDIDATLAAVTEMRILHTETPKHTGDTTAATFVIDNISDQPLDPFCGDGAVNGMTEVCDDGNTVSGDGCSRSCSSELCGDGNIQTAIGEECDDGSGNSNVVPDACRTTCRLPGCGDAVLDMGETCDRTEIGGQTCLSRGFAGMGTLRCEIDCLGYDTSGCIGCGDGVVEGGEMCDDGNTNDNDGCSSSCEIEVEPDGGFPDPDGGTMPPSEGCACRAAGATNRSSSSWPFGLFVLVALRMRKRQ